ncbi:glycosyl transferase [Thermobispora bispora]|uniref:Glycosyl transferase family 9 n=1 Tax=Thermobispora bispora (strain ATCC 19993 / DSM 43833 / CBS 139.67 / JCM 10125 / KCTC 9307 / NBRC 14880 / R51) TaxID=469371 RepID=D6Y5E3_THEBD|nr:glycosyltransferase family 9 protein [Thermobispora bispora]ADG89338.1 glycosyl transferase family 9 [Thermobispora bispora DSM 43833]MBO2473586.1 glycosyltransferase family 9 protein [Actinomycetales bacterium]QSI48999.1 glycosyltransferase family 9 protein [Thermobispora bispora]
MALTAHRTAPAATAPVRAAARGRPVLLALRGLGLGDLLTAVPALRALRRAHPGHRFVLAAPARLAGLLPLIGGVDELLDVSGPGPVPWRGPDVAVNLHGSGPQSTLALCRTRPGRLLTHAHPGIPGVAGPPWREEMHEVRRWCAQLAWYGIPADPGDLALRDPGRSPLRGGEIVIHPGAASGARRWPPERFAEVAAELGRLGHPIVVTGGTAEIGIARRVARLAGLPDGCVLAGRTGLPELAALIAHARLVICGDTGVAHLATAYATPSVVLFGPVSPDRWGPPPGGPHIALWAGIPGDPHADRPSDGLLRIGVPEVLAAARRLLEVSPR